MKWLSSIYKQIASTALALKSSARFTTFLLVSAKAINGFVAFLSSLATVGAFAFALWAYHYSSIPEQLVEKFNSEIAALNEETTDIRREKRLLEERLIQDKATYEATVEESKRSIAELSLIKSSLEEEIASYKDQKDKLEADLHRVKLENTQNQKYRKEYLADSIASLFGVTFTEPLKKEINTLRTQAEQARDLPIWLDIVAEEERFYAEKREYGLLDRKLNPTDIKLKEIKRQSDFIKYQTEKIPDSWLNSVLFGMRMFREQSAPEPQESLATNDQPVSPRIGLALKLIHDEDKEPTNRELAVAFREALSVKPDVMKAQEILKEHIKTREIIINEMPENDRNRVNKSIQTFLSKYADRLNEDVSIYVPIEKSNEEVAEEGRRILENVNSFEEIIMNMSEELSGHLMKE